jgi:hypothetical protein
MPRRKSTAVTTAPVKEEPQEVRGGNAYLQKFTDVRRDALARFSRLSTKKALSQLDAAITPLWADATATVSNAPVGQRKLRSTDCTRLQQLHGRYAQNHIAKLLDKASKNPKQQKAELLEAFILLKQLQLYDNCMRVPGCVPDWLRAIAPPSQNALSEVILISDDEDTEIIDAETADTSTDAVKSTKHVHKRVKLEPVESCDEATSANSSAKVGSSLDHAVNSDDMTHDSQKITGDTDAAAVSDDNIIITQQSTAMTVMSVSNAQNFETMQIESGDTTIDVDDGSVAESDHTATPDQCQHDLLQCIAVEQQPAGTSISNTADATNMALASDKRCSTESKTDDETATEMSTDSSINCTATTGITSAETELELMSTSAIRMQVAACIDYVINTVQELSDRDNTDCVPVELHTSPQEIVTSTATSTSLVNNASFVETPTVSVGPTVSPAPQSIATDCDTAAAAEVSSCTSSRAAALCKITDTTGVQNIANVCVSTTHSMVTNDDVSTAPSHSDNSSASSSTQASSAAVSSYTPVVATDASASTTDSAELNSSVSDCRDNAVPSETMSTASADGATVDHILDTKQPTLVTAASSSVVVSEAHTTTEQLNCNDSSVSTTRAAESSCQAESTANAAAANDTVSTQTADDTKQPNSIDNSVYEEGSNDLTEQRDCTKCNANRNETPAQSSHLQCSDETGTSITSEATTVNMVSDLCQFALVQ